MDELITVSIILGILVTYPDDDKGLNLTYQIIGTIAYSDLFDFPLTLEELRLNLPVKVDKKQLEEILKNDPIVVEEISSKDGYYYMNGREANIRKRAFRKKISKAHWEAIEPYLITLSKIPFVEMIAITGSLSVDNSSTNSDIDFLVVTKPKRVWLTRLILYAFEKIVERIISKRLHLCFNFIISTNNIHQESHNIYIAREIVQMKPVYGYETYRRLLNSNQWIKNFLPNIRIMNHLESVKSKIIKKKNGPRIVNMLLHSKNVITTKLLGLIDYLEYRRAIDRIHRKFSSTKEARFSRGEYKAHFSNHQSRTLYRIPTHPTDQCPHIP